MHTGKDNVASMKNALTLGYHQFTALLSANKNMVALFTAPGCQPCEPVKQRMAEMPGVWMIDASESQALPSQLHVSSVPTVIVFRAGKETTRASGSDADKAVTA